MAGGLYATKLDALSRDEGELEAEQLVVGEASASAVPLGEGSREVDGTQRTCLAHEPVPCKELRGHEVADVTGICQGRRDDATHPGHRDALGHGMDGQDAREVRAVVLGTQNLEEGALICLKPYPKVTLPERAMRSPSLTCSAIHGWRKKLTCMTPVASRAKISTTCMRGRGRLSWTLSATATTVASSPTSACAMSVTQLKSR